MADEQRVTANSHNSTVPRVAVCCFLAISLVVWLIQQWNFERAVAIGLIVPDVVNITNSFNNLWFDGGSRAQGDEFFGLAFIYGWTWAAHPALCYGVNLVLMMVAANVYTGHFVRRRGLPGWTVLGVLANPYLLLAMPGPNKEIPLLVLTLAWFVAADRARPSWMLWGALFAMAAYTFRAGYGLFLLAMVIVLAVVGRHRESALPWVVGLLCVLTTVFYDTLVAISPAIASNRDAFETISLDGAAVGFIASSLVGEPSSPLGALVLFGLRLVYNSLSMALFPVLSTVDGEPYWLGRGYWAYGVALLATLPAAAWATRRTTPSRTLRLSGTLVVSTLLMVSTSQFVQPRYLMPVLPIALVALVAAPAHVRARCVKGAGAIILVIVGGYALLDRSPAPAEAGAFDVPSYILGL